MKSVPQISVIPDITESLAIFKEANEINSLILGLANTNQKNIFQISHPVFGNTQDLNTCQFFTLLIASLISKKEISFCSLYLRGHTSFNLKINYFLHKELWRSKRNFLKNFNSRIKPKKIAPSFFNFKDKLLPHFLFDTAKQRKTFTTIINKRFSLKINQNRKFRITPNCSLNFKLRAEAKTQNAKSVLSFDTVPKALPEAPSVKPLVSPKTATKVLPKQKQFKLIKIDDNHSFDKNKIFLVEKRV